MDAPNPKRARLDVSSSNQNPNHQQINPNFSQIHLDLIISSLLSFPDSSTSVLSSSFDAMFDKALASTSDDVSVQNRLLDRTLELTSLILESTKRYYRERASVHNHDTWLLPPELTSKVFSMLDTKSLMQAMASCKMFQKSAMETSSYSHINLTTSAETVEDKDVWTMISRAGKELRFLELDHVVPPAKPKLTGKCLVPLSRNIGKSLRSLHLYDVKDLQKKSAFSAISACSYLTDLKIVGAHGPCEQLLKALTDKCPFIEKLFFERYGFPGRPRKKSTALVELLTSIIKNLTSLSLIGFRVKDTTLQNLTKNARKLKNMDLSRNTSTKGSFLSDSGSSFYDGPLKTLLLRNCSSLEEKEVSQFLNSVVTGDFRFIRHIDISNNRGLISDGGKSSYYPKLPVQKLKKERPNVTFVADFTSSLKKICGVIPSGKIVRFDLESSDDDNQVKEKSESSDRKIRIKR